MTFQNTTKAQFEAKSEIPRFPKCPTLSPEQIVEITKTVFPLPDPQPADVLFVFGSSRDDVWSQVAGLYLKHKLAPVIYIAGGLGLASFDRGRFLSHIIRDHFLACGVPKKAIIVDEKSANTAEDAVFGKILFEENSIRYDRILFASKWPHAGRCLRTLKKVFPGSELFPFMYDFKYDGVLITGEVRNTWWKHERSRSFVWGEYQRILLYSSRGDIAP